MRARQLVTLPFRKSAPWRGRIYRLSASPLAVLLWAVLLAVLTLGAVDTRTRPHDTLSRHATLPNHERIVHMLDDVLYWLVIVPLIAFLPARAAYGIARLHGDWCYRCYTTERSSIISSLDAILGDQLSQSERSRITRDYFRLRSCEAVDAMRLAWNGRALARLVEMRGLEHIEAALASGKGAVICSGHFGFFDGGFSLLGIRGFPATTIVRRPSLPSLQRIVVDLAFRTKYLQRHRHRSDIDLSEDQLGSAAHAAIVLRSNEVLTTCIEAPPPSADHSRAVDVEFFGRRVRLLPGCILLAKHTGSPVCLVFLHRSSDWRHQILEVSPPIPLDGDTASVLQACVTRIEAAIRRDPAHWRFWSHPNDALRPLGLLATEVRKTVNSQGAAV
ncbi:MAG: lysophospholipid acyltransferase family protein [Ktedonobacterales bacterium]